jgi:hypothetical protein
LQVACSRHDCVTNKIVWHSCYANRLDVADYEVHAGIGVSREYELTLHTKMFRSLYGCRRTPKDYRRMLEKVLGLVS